MRGVATAIGLLVAMSAGCAPSGGAFAECRDDGDCGAGAQCTRTRECIAGTLVAVRINWTIDGQTVTTAAPGPCAGGAIDHLSVSFSENGFGEVNYTPVSCAVGQIYFDKMPPRFDRVALSATDRNGNLVDADSTAVAPGENIVDFDLATD